MTSLGGRFTFQVLAAFVASLLTLIGNTIAWRIPVLDALPGLFILYAVAVAGIVVKQALDKVGVLKQIPTFAWIMLVGLAISIPGVPGADAVVKYTNNVAFLATCTPILAYAGVAASRDLPRLKQVSWKVAILSLFVWMGAFLGAAIVAQILITLLGL
ncbi:MAG: hypothetical protein QXS42_00050 [Zestosphaera sp.]